MKNLNTMDSFTSGFKIERDGKIITLTQEEMSDFRYLDKALIGRECLYWYSVDDNEDKAVVNKMMEDEEICYNIEDEFLDCVLNDSTQLEHDIVEEYIKRFKSEEEVKK